MTPGVRSSERQKGLELKYRDNQVAYYQAKRERGGREPK